MSHDPTQAHRAAIGNFHNTPRPERRQRGHRPTPISPEHRDVPEPPHGIEHTPLEPIPSASPVARRVQLFLLFSSLAAAAAAATHPASVVGLSSPVSASGNRRERRTAAAVRTPSESRPSTQAGCTVYQHDETYPPKDQRSISFFLRDAPSLFPCDQPAPPLTLSTIPESARPLFTSNSSIQPLPGNPALCYEEQDVRFTPEIDPSTGKRKEFDILVQSTSGCLALRAPADFLHASHPVVPVSIDGDTLSSIGDFPLQISFDGPCSRVPESELKVLPESQAPHFRIGIIENYPPSFTYPGRPLSDPNCTVRVFVRVDSATTVPANVALHFPFRVNPIALSTSVASRTQPNVQLTGDAFCGFSQSSTGSFPPTVYADFITDNYCDQGVPQVIVSPEDIARLFPEPKWGFSSNAAGSTSRSPNNTGSAACIVYSFTELPNPNSSAWLGANLTFRLNGPNNALSCTVTLPGVRPPSVEPSPAPSSPPSGAPSPAPSSSSSAPTPAGTAPISQESSSSNTLPYILAGAVTSAVAVAVGAAALVTRCRNRATGHVAVPSDDTELTDVEARSAHAAAAVENAVDPEAPHIDSAPPSLPPSPRNAAAIVAAGPNARRFQPCILL